MVIVGPEIPEEVPFQTIVRTYIKIGQSPLVAIIVAGAVSEVARGERQVLTLEPSVYSFDPDFPEEKVN